ncbi:polysaccharide biosynthesis/export family protein [Chitinophaga oryziterrae]
MYASSCSTPRNITYFKDVPDSVKQKLVDQSVYNTPVIQPDDILTVTILTLDPTATAVLNQQSAISGPSNNNTNNSSSINTPGGNASVYLVDRDGYVILPLLGKVSVKGRTTDQVRDDIRTKATEYYKDPVVNVRFANFKITVLGDVNKPSSYIMPNEKVTLLDALGMAGDLTIYGKRENVMLIRDNINGKKEIVRFNLNDSKIFSSPYFYLHQGDVIYVEPNKAKVSGSDMEQVRRISIFASILSVVIIIVTRINF